MLKACGMPPCGHDASHEDIIRRMIQACCARSTVVAAKSGALRSDPAIILKALRASAVPGPHTDVHLNLDLDWHAQTRRRVLTHVVQRTLISYTVSFTSKFSMDGPANCPRQILLTPSPTQLKSLYVASLRATQIIRYSIHQQ